MKTVLGTNPRKYKALPCSSAASLRDADQPRRNATVVDGRIGDCRRCIQ